MSSVFEAVKIFEICNVEIFFVELNFTWAKSFFDTFYLLQYRLTSIITTLTSPQFNLFEVTEVLERVFLIKVDKSKNKVTKHQSSPLFLVPARIYRPFSSKSWLGGSLQVKTTVKLQIKKPSAHCSSNPNWNKRTVFPLPADFRYLFSASCWKENF